MKKIFVIIAFALFFMNTKAQINFASSAEISLFLKSKTYVVLSDDPISNFDSTIKVLMPKLWKITPYEFITPDQFDAKKVSNKNSFIMLSDAEQSEDGVLCKYNFLNLILGGNSDINRMPDLGSVPLGYADVDEDQYMYKLGGMLVFMQYHVKYANEHPSTKPSLLNKESTTSIKNKELWLLKEDLAPNCNTLEKIKTVYPNTVKIVTKEELRKAIESMNPNVVYLHKVGPEGTIVGGKCWKFLVCAKDGEVLYYDGHKVDASNPDAMLLKDFKAIAK
jgi:hypothetical protein